MDNKKNNITEDEEKTVLLDEDEQRTVLLDEEDQKTVLLDEEEKTALQDEEEQQTDMPKESAVSADSDVKPHQLSPGSVLNDRYTVERVIGEGGFGITYKGYDKKFDIPVAIKEYFPHSMVMRDTSGERGNTLLPYDGRNKELYEKYLARFFSEARTLAKLQSIPGVVHVQDYFNENGTAYIVMEYVDGKNLKEYAKEKGGRISSEEALDLFYPVATALGELHKHGILHRDISPDNIMVTKEGKVTLIDLGASRELGDDQRTMTVLLKPGYSPLEQYTTGAKQGPYSDLYSFCASFYRVITGKTPGDAMERLTKDTLEAPSALGVNINPNVENALLKGLSVKADDRYQSMEELNDVFYRGKTQERVSPAPTAPKPKAAKAFEAEPDISEFTELRQSTAEPVKRKSKLPVIIIASAALAGIVTFLLIFLNMSNETVYVDQNGNTLAVAGTETIEAKEGDNQTADLGGASETADIKDYNRINVPAITPVSTTNEGADILKENGNLARSGQKDTFNFVTPRDGRYRVQMSGLSSGMTVDMRFLSPTGEELGAQTGCRNGEGVTVKYLEANKNYTIEISQNKGTGGYGIDVGIQKPTPDISGITQINDSVEYTEQRNLYNFTVPKNGTYRFEMANLASGTDTQMYIFDDPGNKISEDTSCRNGEGLTLKDVKAGDIYEIQVRQNTGLSSYTLNIGQQKEQVNIKNKDLVADSMEFTDQVNVYSYNASSSGSVTFTMREMPSDMTVEMHVISDSGQTLASEVNCRKDSGISIQNVAAGEHFVVKVAQSAGRGQYSMSVN